MEYINYDETISLMDKLFLKCEEDVAVFTDRGWGDDPEQKREYSIIIDGDGQKPYALISKETFEELKKNKIIGPNILQTYKARTYHVYKRKKQE